MCLKEKTFNCNEPAFRHTVENAKARERFGPVTPIIVHVHDGASDYNMTLGGALLAHLAEYVLTGADMVLSMRFCPYQSYNDPAERVMSLLNMGLQALALARSEMPAEMEDFMKTCSSMADVRKLAAEHPQVKSAVTKAMEEPIRLVAERFEKLEWTENPIAIIPPATDSELLGAWESLLVIDQSIQRGGTLKKVLVSKASLQEFLETHTRQRTYMVQTMKTCKGKDRKFGCKGLMMPEAKFDKLHFVPDPVLNNGGDWTPFQEAYGTKTTEHDRPSRTAGPHPRMLCVIIAVFDYCRM